MNGLTRETFLTTMKAGGEAADEMLADVLWSIHEKVSFRRTVTIALMGAVLALAIRESPAVLSALRGLL